MNKKILETLEYQKIVAQIKDYLTTEKGLEISTQMIPSSDLAVVEQWLAQTADGADILRLKGEIPIPKLINIDSFIKRLNIENAALSGTELAHIKKLMQSTVALNRFFEQLEEEAVDLRELYQMVSELVLMPDITQRIMTSVNDDGRLLDDASSELRRIRRKITTMQRNIRQRMDKYVKGNESKYLSEPIVTMRDDRFVVPVKAEYKAHFGGIIHDQSASGQTLYIEPSSVVELNNQLRREQLAERAEERRLLLELTDLLRPVKKFLISNMQLVGRLDFINAKAKYAKAVNGVLPKLSQDNVVNLRKARHPLIDQAKVVANDIAIGDSYRSIIVTGPNTGGKTITIKTVGLLQLMGQSGLFITANEESQIGVFDDIFADIGDEQSIEANLSTFSSHIDNIGAILQQIDSNSLVLLDELGAGTDPKEGAALAMAIIDKIGELGSMLIATTHYPELKAYAYSRPNTINASMEFDVDTLRPTYHLLLGIPGQSNAFNIARKLGIASDIIDKAISFTDDQNQDINSMIEELTYQTKIARQDAEELQEQLADAKQLHAELKTSFDKYQNQKEALMEAARNKANEVVNDSKAKADEIIKDLRSKQVNSVKENELMDAKGALNSLELAPELKKNRVLRKEKAKHDFHVGDDVYVKSYGQQGVLLKKHDSKTWDVQIGILKMRLDVADLEKGQAPKETPQYKARVARTKSSGLSTTLDLRGERYDAAMSKLDQYIDSALLAGYPAVTIIHGKGTGALRAGVQQYLTSHPRIKNFNYSSPNAGGDGSTVVNFK